ncbi:hypothetical protein TrVE_jg8393 [Triparma verrucosa]|uniref:Uncharacterized protein n=1 Tax=Triparma verrucosa TaxID=1606542 RepID=A0A9W7CIR3_9STRA|nr:hypothetical protein TrVE_jg8393 [Triparma verrucosa]
MSALPTPSEILAPFVTSAPPTTSAIVASCFESLSFFTAIIVGEAGNVAGDFGRINNGWFAIFRIPIWCFTFWLGLKLCESAGKLPPQGLSDFLCQTVLVKGTAAMGTILFFTFEGVSCFISQASLDNGQCLNTSIASVVLSGYVVILTTLSACNKAVPRSVQREMAWELASIASLKGLKWWQRLQGFLLTVAAIVSLYLLSVLGVEGNENSMVFVMGAMGGASMLFVFIINVTMLVKTRNEHLQSGDDVKMTKTHGPTSGISAEELEEEMFAAALV